MAYDDGNVFARILRGDIPCNKVYEDDHVLAFHDVHPQAPIHILIIPKRAYVSFDDFGARASAAEAVAFIAAIPKVARIASVHETGYRTLANHGVDSGQEVPHFHLHLLGGRPLGPMLTRG